MQLINAHKVDRFIEYLGKLIKVYPLSVRDQYPDLFKPMRHDIKKEPKTSRCKKRLTRRKARK